MEKDEIEKRLKLMVEDQILSRGVKNPKVLSAMLRVPRQLFVPDDLREAAYMDGPLEIGNGQTISQPYIVAYMTECLDLTPDDKVLEIGTGSGYQAAILAEIAGNVYTVERDARLAHRAEARLRDLGYQNIHFKTGDGWKGWPEKAPYDKIIVTAAAEVIPADLVEQLHESGKMIVPVGSSYGFQELIEGEKRHGNFQTHRKIAVRFVPLVKD